MNPFEAILFLIFVLPAVMIKTLFKMLTKNMSKEDKKKWLWRIPYVLIILLFFIMLILYNAGFR